MRNTAFRLPVLVSLFLLLSWLPLHETKARAMVPSRLNSVSELIAAVNALRASNGLPAYHIHPTLMKIAQAHADYQASIGSTTHYSADGARPFQRALTAGYPVAGDLSRGGFFSENIMSGTNLTASGAVSAWQGDAPHLNTMLSPNLQDVGAGVSTSGSMTYYTLDAGLASGSPVSYTAAAGTNSAAPGTALVSEFMQPVQINTPDENGAVYHEVQFGQTLWTLAITYKTTVEQIKLLNQLSSIDIYEGQKLLIKRVSTTAPTTTKTLEFTATFGIPSSTPVGMKLNTLTPTADPIPAATTQNSGVVLFAIIAAALLAAGLGTWISTRKPV